MKMLLLPWLGGVLRREMNATRKPSGEMTGLMSWS
jgi:hypothetical protein